jgi:hypothetical protein
VSAAGHARRSTAGFTLVELMVALTGGLFVSLAVFALARDSGRFYQREARIANATIGGLLGFERLRADIARAGYLSSPNINRDPRQCGKPNAASWPQNLLNLASIQVSPSAIVNSAWTANGRTPPQLLLAGAYTSSDLFSAQVTAIGAQTVFQLQASQPALLRLGGGANPTQAMMDGAFPATRALRIVQYGRTYFGQITGATGTPGLLTVTVGASPTIQSWDGNPCGLKLIGSNTLATINIVNFIHYDLRNLSSNAQTTQAKATYASLYSDSAAGPGEAQRTELVRIEQAANGNAIVNTEEIVAEYAVDFDIQVNAVTSFTGVDPQVNTIASTDARFGTYTGPTFLAANMPDRIRSVRVRLGVRSREGDRDNTVANPTGNGLFRFLLGAGPGTVDAYARVRTFQADVALHNQADVLW